MLPDEIVDRASLERYIATTDWPEFVYFWGHTSKDNKVGRHVLSQWWQSQFRIAGTDYSTAEHFMMAEKARMFGDLDSRSKILAAPTPLVAKTLGRAVAGYDDARWACARFEVVCRGSLAKFSQNAELRKFLLSTKDAVLVEASPVDTIWGIGLGPDDAGVHPQDWRGLNLLGFALMKVRAALKEEDAFVGDAIATMSRPWAYMKQTKWIKPHELDDAVAVAVDLTDRSNHFLSHRTDLSECMAALIEVLSEPDCHCRRDSEVQAVADEYACKLRACYDTISLGGCDPQ